MALVFKPLHPLFAAIASGFNLTPPLTEEQVREIDAGMNRHAVLVFRNQALDEDQQIRFAKSMGPLDLGLLQA